MPNSVLNCLGTTRIYSKYSKTMKHALIAAILALAGLSGISAHAATPWDAFLSWVHAQRQQIKAVLLHVPRDP
jgi:uncharacterized membrane protein